MKKKQPDLFTKPRNGDNGVSREMNEIFYDWLMNDPSLRFLANRIKEKNIQPQDKDFPIWKDYVSMKENLLPKQWMKRTKYFPGMPVPSTVRIGNLIIKVI